MKKTLVKLIALALFACMLVPAMASCAAEKYTGADTLVVGYDTFSEKFSPFFSKTAYDQDVAAMTQVLLLGTDREGNIVLLGKTGQTTPFNGKDYKYTGLADCKVTQNDDGTVVYEFDLRKNVKFSDGVKLTADDVIFSMYALSDPTYDGSSTFYAQPIKGMEEYRAGMDTKFNLIVKAGRDNTDYTYFTAEEQTALWADIDQAGAKFAQEIVDYCAASLSTTTVAEGAAKWGFKDLAADATAADFFLAMCDAYAYDLAELSSVESAGSDLFDLMNDYNSYLVGVSTGDSAATITGIEKTGDYSLKITMTKFDAVAIYQLGVSVAPLHYYGSTELYDYDANKFGFVKGDLSSVRAKTTTPMGAGAYKFVEFANGIVKFERNEHYFEGTPKITYIKFQEVTSNADKVAGIVTGTLDVSDPSLTNSIIDSIKEANTSKELTGDVITYNAVDNLGYGYIGINADNVKVGADKTSDASKALRKAFATLFAVYRDTVIDSYYGERATVIQYPISNTSWAAPRPADPGYAIAYSKDAAGAELYTDGMSSDDKFAAALTGAISFFKAAGYTWDEASGKFTAAPDGAAMSYEVIIPADGIGDHPSYAILTSTKTALETVGITLNINDPSDSNVLWDSIEAGTCAMWAAAWGATPDPDMYQVYHSSNIVGKGGTDSNHYAIADDNLDKLILDARTSADTSYRKATYKQCLDILLDWGVEIPTYQRQNCLTFSTARVNIESLTPDITTFWGWMNDIEQLEMN